MYALLKALMNNKFSLVLRYDGEETTVISAQCRDFKIREYVFVHGMLVLVIIKGAFTGEIIKAVGGVPS